MPAFLAVFAVAAVMVVTMIPHVSVYAGQTPDLYYGRSALQTLNRGNLLVQAYDNAVAAADAFAGGSQFSASYGLSEDLTFAESVAVMRAVENDHPEYTWWSSNTFSAGSGGFTVLFNGNHTYYTAATLNKRNTQFELATDTFLKKAGIHDDMNDFDKAYALYQVLIGNVTYNIEYMDQSAYAAFVDRQAVCAGYAKAYTYLLQKAGIKASYVPGEATAGQEAGGHAWVLVQIDGQYYYCDPTLDDGGATPKYQYFMKTDADMSGNHWIDDVGYTFPRTANVGLSVPTSTYRITSAATTGGQIYPDSLYVRSGSRITVTMVPDEGYLPDTLTVGAESVTPVAQEDGSYLYTVESVTGDLGISGTFKPDTMTSTKLVAAGDSYTVNQGDSVSLTAALTTTTGTALMGQTVSFDSGTDFHLTAVTDYEGLASVELDTTAMDVGAYSVRIHYAGSETRRESSAEITLRIVEKKEITRIEAGNLVFYATYGGELKESEDYYYNDVRNILTFYNDTPITVGMKEGAEEADVLIEYSANEGQATLTLKDLVLNQSSDTKVATIVSAGIYAPDLDLNLNLVGSSSITVAENTGSISKVYGIQAKSLTIAGDGQLTISAGNAGQDSVGIYTGDLKVHGGMIMVQSGDVSEWSISRTYGVQAEGTITMNGGSLTAVSGTYGYDYNVMGTCGIYAKAITISRGTLQGTGGTAVKGITMGAYVNSGNLSVNGGTIKGVGGISQSRDNSDTVGSYGMFVNGDTELNAGEIYAEGSEGALSCGLVAGSSLSIKGGKLTSIGGEVFDSESLGCLVQEDYTQTAGTVHLSSGVSPEGDSRGIRQVNPSGKFQITGGTLQIDATQGESLTYKGLYVQGGFAIFKGGTVVIRSGKALYHSVGIYSENTLTFEDGIIDTEGNDVGLTEGEEVFSTGIFAGNHLSVKGGAIRAVGKKAPNSYGIYTYDKINISGGKIDATGETRGLDGYSSGITGGSYSAGDPGAGTVCGYKVASGYTVTKGSDSSYPYNVSRTGETTDGNVDSSKTDTESDGSGDTGSGDKDGTGTETPSVGTKEKDASGKATYQVSETSKSSGGKTVVEVTYVAPTAKEKKAASVTVPNTVTLSDGTKAQVTTVGANAFKKDTKLKKVTIGSNVESIGKNAFSGCSNLATVTIKGNSLKKVNAGAFQNCKKLTKVTLGKNVTTIDKNAFSGDKNLKTITINGNSLKKVGKNAFKSIKKNAVITIQAKDKKTYNKIVKMIKKSGAKNVKYTFKKKK